MIAETFISGRGPLYRLDPRPKFILLLCIVFFFLFESNPLVSAVLMTTMLGLIWISLGWRRMFTPIKSILPILILTAVLTPPFNLEGAAILRVFGKTILTDSGLALTLGLILRFTGITTVFYLFFSTTETSSFILALRSLGLPYRAALTVTISLRYIPDMFSTYYRIADAHKLRTAGNNPGRKGFKHRLSRQFPVLISVLINAVKSIPALAMALDSKGLGRSNARTSCRKLCRWRDITLQLAITLVIILVLAAVFILI